MNYFEREQVHYIRENTRVRFEEYQVAQFPAHWHVDAEIIMVTSGTVNIGYNFDAYSLSAGDFMLIPGGNIHHFGTPDDGRALLLLFDAEAIMSKEDAEGFAVPVIIRDIDASVFTDIYERIRAELTDGGMAHKLMIKSYLGLISGWIMRNRSEETVLKSKQIRIKLLNDSQKLFKYIEAHYDKELSLETGARLMHFEKNYFCRYFKALTGTTFVRYVNMIRSRAAQDMLRTTDLPVREIASICGFNTVRTFNREFKALTGATAVQYRKRPNY